MVAGQLGRVVAQLATSSKLVAQQQQTLLESLDPATRAGLLAAFAGFLILGIALIVFAWLGARVTRRYMNQGSAGQSRRTPIHDDDWAKKPLDRD